MDFASHSWEGSILWQDTSSHFITAYHLDFQEAFNDRVRHDTLKLKLKTYSKKIILAQKYTTNKKSTILVQFPLNLVKIISPWVGNIAKVSAKLE